MHSITLLSPAKINLTLEVIRKRQDGYHDIRSIVQPINLFDEVRIEVEKGDGITLESTGIEIPRGKENLAWRAAEVFLKECGISLKIRIFIKKRIPVGAGLGGGSGNAAAVLVGINRITNKFSEDDLIRFSSKIGADVPLFIHCRSSIIEGIGDKVTLISSFPLFYYVLLNPGFEVSTKRIYELWDEAFKEEGLIRDGIEHKISLFRRGEFPLINDLEKLAIAIYPEIKNLREKLISMDVEAVSMTGSGPTVFGVFNDEKKAKMIYDYFRDSTKFKVFFAQGISGWHRL
ncbi:MAG: 4-diphosphocytidyl-2-C-methyl-D-erythritol kinase, 4-diphosphocytidyl-2-C-methyl-D-erythritol kinase [Candidatus Dadabacteria bacterium CSP1-2]|nr:MAG: 4-diphosphocytidyl-2-C-methyl-D-erythritol kinase, 4-diphosphocytidyl-2-C-methyl-D-erythritol kinase [Candidatus Dadabacteria bacterium CSP1-2]